MKHIFSLLSIDIHYVYIAVSVKIKIKINKTTAAVDFNGTLSICTQNNKHKEMPLYFAYRPLIKENQSSGTFVKYSSKHSNYASTFMQA